MPGNPEPEESRNDRSFAMSLRFRLPPENGLRVSRPATRPVELLPGPPGAGSREHWREEQSLIGPGLPAVMQWAELTIASASGAFLTDVDGNEYIDLLGASGVNSIGHSHPALVAALKEQVDSWMVGAYGSRARLDMLELLQRMLPPGLDRIQLYSGGAEAVEAALRLAKAYTGKYEFLSFWDGFHGKTLGALALTSGARKDLGPLPPGFFSAPFANCYRCPLRCAGCDLACLDLVRSVIREQSSGALAAIIVEPVQGKAGNVPAPPGYLRALKELAHEHGALLIADEMITGFGRTGELFGCDHDGIIPDIALVGKGMAGGYPVSGVISSSEIMSAAPFSDPSASSSSYGGFPTACAAVAATLGVIVEEDLVARSRTLGAELIARLKELEGSAPLVGEVRGQGLMIGIELVEDRETRAPVSRETVQGVFRYLLEQGVLVMVGGNSLRLYPPLSIAPETAHRAVDVIERVLLAEGAQ
ncbi:MAG: aspartate aminotransferase family protein [Actinobacteria bacterium]|nr:MAG: aspartate aminotransferase family protein [Actinomycetota bacterium]